MAQRKDRVVVGVHAVSEALRIHKKAVSRVWIKREHDSADLQSVLQMAKNQQIKIELKSKNELDKLALSNQGIAAFVQNTPEFDWDSLRNDEPQLILVLDGIEDPHNLGAILRSAWLLGANALFVPQSRAVGLTATVAKVACGGAEHVPVEMVTNLEQTLKELKENGFWIYGFSHEAKTSLWQEKLDRKSALVIGSEEKGMRVAVEKQCDIHLSIPQVNASASYNASVAAALATAEWSRSHQNALTVKK